MDGNGESHPPRSEPCPGGEFVLGGLPLECMNRVLRTAHRRCQMLGTEFSTAEIATQLSIRAAVLHKDRGRRERAAFLNFCSALVSDRKDVAAGEPDPIPTDAAAGSVLVRDWLKITNWDEIVDLHRFLHNSTRGRLVKHGRGLFDELIRALGQTGDPSCEHERAMRLAGISRCRSAGNFPPPPKCNWKPIPRELLQEIEDRVGQEDGGTDELLQQIGINNQVELCQMMARTAWLTGMRTPELFRFTIENAERASADAPADQEVVMAGPPMHPATAADNNYSARMLRIRTTKTHNARPSLRQQFRVQMLDGIDDDDLACIERVSRLCRLNLSRKQIKNLVAKCNRRMRLASLDVVPKRPDPITLHCMRHAFIDHARLVMRPPRIAALTGHTARYTMTGYGRRYRRYRASAKANRWFPTPDPRRVSEIARDWNLPDPGPSMEPAAEYRPQCPDPGMTDVA